MPNYQCISRQSQQIQQPFVCIENISDGIR